MSGVPTPAASPFGNKSGTLVTTTPVSAPVPAVPVAPAAPQFNKTDIDTVTRAADTFTRLYYTAYDSYNRLRDLPNFYLDGLKELITHMPPTKHEMQSFDCHPVPGTSPPSLLLTVSGNVTHGKGATGNPPNTGNKTIDGHPRVFSQTFILIPDPNAPTTGKVGEVAKYFITADALRFVG
ncbi:hypothetical protein BDZ89DRAFT_1069391 [Hymenopellis radicata]|nr:hypothetical protein BDZ89DRAFT_1069391 [Hymenopellis radicata]